MGFRLVPKSVTLNDIMAVILCYSTKYGSFGASYIKVVEDRPILSETKTQWQESRNVSLGKVQCGPHDA